MRNGIYAVRGYCFKTDRGKAEFGNDGCHFDDEAEVPLNDYERANVKLIREHRAAPQLRISGGNDRQ